MPDPIFSVVVPTYNYGRFIGQCIESVLSQSFREWELVITDDQSNDDTEAIVHDFGDKRIRYVRNAERLGMYPNFRKAIELSRGQYIKPLPADDYLLPDCLYSFNRLFTERKTVALGSCGVEVVDWKGDYLDERVLPCSGKILSVEMTGQLVAKCGCVFGGNSHYCFPREAYMNVGGYPSEISYSGDFGLAALLSRTGEYYAIPKILVGGRIHGVQSGVRDTTSTVHIGDRFRVYDIMFAPHPALSNAESLKKQARRRDTAVYSAIALKSLLLPAKRQWARSVLTLLRKEMNITGIIMALLVESPALIRHYVAAQSLRARRVKEARNTTGPDSLPMGVDPSVGGGQS